MNFINLIRHSLEKILKMERKKYPDGIVAKRKRSNIPFFLSNFSSEGLPVDVIKKMRTDGQVKAGLSAIKYPILSAKYTVTGKDDAVVEFVKQNLMANYQKLMKSLLTSIDFGFSASELVYEMRGDKVYISDVVDIDPEGVELMVNDGGAIQEIKLRGDISIPPEKCVIFTHQLEFGNPYGTSRLLPAHKFWRIKELIYLFTNRYYERKGNPPTLVKYPQSGGYNQQDDNAQQTALEIGEKLMENAVVALPGVRDELGNNLWSIEYLMDDARGRMFLDYIKHLNAMILRSMIVPEKVISQDETVGSYSMAKTHLDIFLLSVDGLINELSDCITSQFIKPLLRINYGDDFPEVDFQIETLSQQNRELLQEILIEMIKEDKITPDANKIASFLGIDMK